MTRSGILPDLFTLAEGKWTLIKPDGSRQEVESDGTKTIDMREYQSASAKPLGAQIYDQMKNRKP